MTSAKALLYGFVFIVGLMALGLYALYQISSTGFGFALGVLVTAVIGMFFAIILAVSNRILNGGGVRQSSISTPQLTPAQWQAMTAPSPMIDANYHPVLGSTRPPLPAQSMRNLDLVDSGTIETWGE